jgi:hypothetical protein
MANNVASIRGENVLNRRLKAIASQASGKQTEAALTVGMFRIVSTAKEIVVKVSGTLGRSLHVGGHTELTPDFSVGPTQGRPDYGDIGGNVAQGTKSEVRGGTNIEYGPDVEFGTGKRRPKPYLRPAYDQEKQAALEDVAVTLVDLIERGAGA